MQIAEASKKSNATASSVEDMLIKKLLCLEHKMMGYYATAQPVEDMHPTLQ
jgi:hypothetical protein